MRRCDCSTKTTAAMMRIPTAITTMRPSTRTLLFDPIAMSEAGNCDTIEVKISSDIPLPTPRSVMSSPSHMISPVPAVMVMTMSTIASGESSARSGSEQPGNSWPLRATVMSVVDCSTASAMVR